MVQNVDTSFNEEKSLFSFVKRVFLAYYAESITHQCSNTSATAGYPFGTCIFASSNSAAS